MGKTIYAILGKCGETHYFEVDLDLLMSRASMLEGRGPVVKFKEVELKSNQGIQIKSVIFDEMAEVNDEVES